MKRFSKALVTLLVVITILGTLSVGFAAPADVAGTDYEKAVTRLSALGIMGGFPDGTFKPGDPLTRAQAARIVVSALGLDKAAELAKGATAYTDVPADHWASGYINVANSLGIIAGMGDGTFQPEANVTYAQILKMMLMAMNYGPALKKATWPTGYIAMADQIGLSDDVNVAANVPAVRGDVAVIVNNALDIPMLEQKGYGDLETYEPSQKANYNILHEKLKVDEYAGQVVATPEYSALEEHKFTVKDSNGNTTTLTAADDIDVDALLGLDVTAWKKDGKVFFVTVDTSSSDILTGVATLSSGKVKINGTKYDEDLKALVFVNNENISSDTVADFVYYKGNAGANLDVYGTFVVDGDKLVFANALGLTRLGIVDSVSENRGKIYFAVGSPVTIDEDTDKIVKDGKTITIADITEGDVVYTAALNDNSDYDNIYVVVSNKVEGNLDKVKSDTIYIDGTAYTLKQVGSVSASLAGDQVVATLGIDGKVVLVETKESTDDSFYAVVIKTYDLETPKVKLLKADGTKVTYALTDDVSSTTFKNLAANDIVKVTLNSDGEIKAVTEQTVPTIGIQKINKDRDTLFDGSTYYYITEDTAIFSVDNAVYSAADWASIEKINITNPVNFGIFADGLKVKVLIASNLNNLTQSTKYAVVTDAWQTEDGWYLELDPANGEDAVTYFVYDDKAGAFNGEDFINDVISFKINAEGDISEQTVTASVYFADDSGVSTVKAGKVKAVDGRFVTVNISGSDKTYYVADDALIAEYNSSLTTTNKYEAGTLTGVVKDDTIKFVVDATSNEIIALLRQ